LDYDGDVENDMMCTFRIGYTDMFGSSFSKELKENGANIAVTKENRKVNTARLLTEQLSKLLFWNCRMQSHNRCLSSLAFMPVSSPVL